MRVFITETVWRGGTSHEVLSTVGGFGSKAAWRCSDRAVAAPTTFSPDPLAFSLHILTEGTLGTTHCTRCQGHKCIRKAFPPGGTQPREGQSSTGWQYSGTRSNKQRGLWKALQGKRTRGQSMASGKVSGSLGTYANSQKAEVMC